ncbi:uncharacterized protein LOC107778189 isoform X3 [Nicotiana tabacum]|uniref:Uncharacterized protein KIAA0930 homolog isoform X3 n=2 Tax=Nicotiana TaxID=4085 RepID=A0A1S3YPE4_TOBAC|nr:PREDICTED: uncharacterized protein KIAA0930 homolog isoform X3 [Nicotiana sylvestris]XP_016453882.1 PREDICTED: uncharacterized protein KIAA0930 homolog isoform X3 [Nicotiana tabacum]
MLGKRSQTPSRNLCDTYKVAGNWSELLSMVKKHSEMLGKTTVDEEDASDVEVDPRFWHDVMDLYFICGKESRGRQEDDLVFFVKRIRNESNEYVDDDSPYFVRRWAPKLDDLIGGNSSDVDWRRSFYLNLISQTSFSVTVTIYSHRVLMSYQNGKDGPLSPIYKVVKTVYASPSRIKIHLDSRKEVETTPAYPEICFAIDDFDSTFGAVVLTDVDHCYCVLLNAHDGAAFPSERALRESSSCDTSSSKSDTSSGKITLFSGFISYEMVRDAYDDGRSGLGSLLSLNSSGKTDRIYMKGPGGRGEVEVAVSGVVDQSKQESGHHSTKGLSFGVVVRRAASVASMAAKHAYAAASATRCPDGGLIPLKCCLMSISLPWEHIAHDLLFKVKIHVKEVVIVQLELISLLWSLNNVSIISYLRESLQCNCKNAHG